MTEACKAVKSMSAEIYAPKVGETIRIGENMENYTIALSDALMSSLKMAAVGLLLPSKSITDEWKV